MEAEHKPDFLYRLELFASADTAYVLAYSIIMLTTDLHNPQVGVMCVCGGGGGVAVKTYLTFCSIYNI